VYPALPASKIDGRRSVGFEGVAVLGRTRSGGGVNERRARERLVRSAALLVVIGVAGGAVAGACQFLTNVAEVPS